MDNPFQTEVDKYAIHVNIVNIVLFTKTLNKNQYNKPA